MKRRNVIFRLFECPECQLHIEMPKNSGNRTKNGHIKTMWCPKCKVIRDFTQTDLTKQTRVWA